MSGGWNGGGNCLMVARWKLPIQLFLWMSRGYIFIGRIVGPNPTQKSADTQLGSAVSTIYDNLSYAINYRLPVNLLPPLSRCQTRAKQQFRPLSCRKRKLHHHQTFAIFYCMLWEAETNDWIYLFNLLYSFQVAMQQQKMRNSPAGSAGRPDLDI